MAATKEAIGHFVQTMKARYERCLEPSFACEKQAISAHSVQNATAMDLIAHNNHVYGFRPRLGAAGPKFSFQMIGRKQASTFTGLCSDHDSEIFRPIDTRPLSLNDPEQLFLIAYRSVTRELHTVLEAVERLQKTYKYLVAAGRVEADKPSMPALEIKGHMDKAFSVWRYREEHYDEAFQKARFDDVQHSTFVIEGRPPVLAASSFFSIDNKRWGERFKAVCLNVVPLTAAETAVIVSFPKAHSGDARRYVASVFLKEGDARLQALSRLIIDRAENFFLSPPHLESWSPEKRQLIETAYVGTVEGRTVPQNPELMLF
jgi:hypothetical protein